MAAQEASDDVAAKRDRAAGAVMGLFIGDALGLGPHWYYDLEELRKEYGTVAGYTDPKPGRYHAGCHAGDLSQTGQVCELLLRSLAEQGRYDEPDFCCRLDTLMDTLDGTAEGGRYTDVAMREVWRARKRDDRPWGQAAGWSNTSEAAQRAVVLAARYAADLGEAARLSMSNIRLTHQDATTAGQSMSFAILVAALIQGHRLDDELAWGRLWPAAKAGELPIAHAVLAGEERQTPVDSTATMPRPDTLFQAAWVAAAARSSRIAIPPELVGLVYGMGCNLDFLLPASFYLSTLFEREPCPAARFKQAVLAAVNSGGNNMARAAMTGALVGAQVGLSAIPHRFVEGLTGGRELAALATQLAAVAFPEPAAAPADG